ncbi:MAG: hypothetical protein ACLGI9_06570 [Thermoanaerobaculia bacterium]
MTVDALPAARKPLTTSRALLFGGLTVGTLDILDAFIFNGVRSGISPTRILQFIASGVLGREAAFSGGGGAAALGLLLHYLIAFVVVAVYLFASGRLPVLAQRPFVFGPLYGLAVHLVMHYGVVPLSAVTRAPGPMPLVVHVNQWLIHAFGIGLVTALFARAARRG